MPRGNPRLKSFTSKKAAEAGKKPKNTYQKRMKTILENCKQNGIDPKDYDPLMFQIAVAMGDHKALKLQRMIPDKMRIRANEILLDFYEPKKKAIEQLLVTPDMQLDKSPDDMKLELKEKMKLLFTQEELENIANERAVELLEHSEDESIEDEEQ